MTIEYQIDRSRDVDVLTHLRSCDGAFVPPLSSRLDLTQYAARLAARATRFEAWDGGRLVGLVACYLNDFERRVGFVTSVSVTSEMRGKGVARVLMENCVDRARTLGFVELRLEVAPSNGAAVELYRRCGFDAAADGGAMTTMNLSLESLS